MRFSLALRHWDYSGKAMVDNTQPLILAADADGIAAAARLLQAGKLVAVPTETVYGLAARADSDAAVGAIYRAKGRPDFNPLIVHVSSLAQAESLARFDANARALAARFWPGPLTMVLPRRAEAGLVGTGLAGTGLAAAVTAGLPTVALRCPAHPAMRALLDQAQLPLAAPSANRSGGVSPSCAAHVADSLGTKVDLILDGGPCQQGIESTIVALRDFGGWQILRPGPITRDQIAAVLGEGDDGAASPAGIEAPGQLASHYAPGKPVRLNALEATDDEFHIGFGAIAGDISLSPSGDLAEAAARLYLCLHASAQAQKLRIAIAPVPEEGIGAAINDRLRRAAA